MYYETPIATEGTTEYTTTDEDMNTSLATTEDSTMDVEVEVEDPSTVKEKPTTLNAFTTTITPAVTEDFFGFGSVDVQSDENCPLSCSE